MSEPTIPLSEEAAKEEAQRLIAAAYQPTHYRDDTPLPRYGTNPPVPQPGIPPQSSGAVDYAVRVLATGVTTALCSGGVALVLYVSRFADPVVCGIIFGAPIGLAVPIAALSSLAKRWKHAAPAPTINHYNAPVHQQHTHSNTLGMVVKNINTQ